MIHRMFNRLITLTRRTSPSHSLFNSPSLSNPLSIVSSSPLNFSTSHPTETREKNHAINIANKGKSRRNQRSNVRRRQPQDPSELPEFLPADKLKQAIQGSKPTEFYNDFYANLMMVDAQTKAIDTAPWNDSIQSARMIESFHKDTPYNAYNGKKAQNGYKGYKESNGYNAVSAANTFDRSQDALDRSKDVKELSATNDPLSITLPSKTLLSNESSKDSSSKLFLPKDPTKTPLQQHSLHHTVNQKTAAKKSWSILQMYGDCQYVA